MKILCNKKGCVCLTCQKKTDCNLCADCKNNTALAAKDQRYDEYSDEACKWQKPNIKALQDERNCLIIRIKEINTILAKNK